MMWLVHFWISKKQVALVLPLDAKNSKARTRKQIGCLLLSRFVLISASSDLQLAQE